MLCLNHVMFPTFSIRTTLWLALSRLLCMYVSKCICIRRHMYLCVCVYIAKYIHIFMYRETLPVSEPDLTLV